MFPYFFLNIIPVMHAGREPKKKDFGNTASLNNETVNICEFAPKQGENIHRVKAS